MSENKELHEENLNKEGQENLQNEQNTTESVTEQPTAEELLAEEKDRYIRLYAEFENYKKRTLKEKMEFAENCSIHFTRRKQIQLHSGIFVQRQFVHYRRAGQGVTQQLAACVAAQHLDVGALPFNRPDAFAALLMARTISLSSD